MADHNNILPVVGSRGLYVLLAPFDTIITSGVEYTCQAIRRLSEKIAWNEDPKSEIYLKYGISDAIYDDDLKNDAYIVSLQSAKGHWVHVPYRYISSYPSGDAVQYRTVMLQFSLQPLPLSHDFSDLKDRIDDLIRQSTGVAVESRVTQTSQVVLVKRDIHEAREIARALNSSGSTYAQEVEHLIKENGRLLQQLQKLEDYIKANKAALGL